MLAIAEAGSVRGAAQRLFTAQPPLSRTVRDLERRLGFPLFVRSPRGMTPTAEGAELVTRARDILERLDNAADLMDDLATGRTGHLRIGYTDDFQYGWLPEVIAKFLESHPGVEIHLEQDYSPMLAEGVAAGSLDVAFLAPPVPPHLTDLELEPLGRVPLRLLLPAGHPLTRAAAVPVDALAGETIIVGALRPESGFYIQMMQALRERRVDARFLTGVYPTAMITNLVARGLGWSVVPAESLAPGRSDVVDVPFEDSSLAIERGVVWRPGTLTPTSRAFLACAAVPLAPPTARVDDDPDRGRRPL